jgi:chromosome segregation ATPase
MLDLIDNNDTPPAGEKPPVDFQKWLEGQPEEIRKAYEDHTKGLKSALESERDKAKRLEKEQKDKAKAESDAEAERLKQQGEFRTLAEQAQAKATELEKQLATLTPASERLKVLEGVVSTYLAKEREGLPAHVLTLLDALLPEKQLEYIAQNRQALKPSQQQPGGGIPPTPVPGTPPGKLSDEERHKRAWKPRL